MKIDKIQVDDLNLQLNLAIEKADCAEKVKKTLSDYRKKADIKGFRKGMAPMSLIEKMYGTSALADCVNDKIAEGLNDYISENKLRVIGEPLPSEDKQKKIDWENDTTFEFVFDVALYPEFKVQLTKKDKITEYDIEVSQEAKDNYKANMLRQYGKLENAEVAGEEDFIIADLEQNGTVTENTYISLKSIKTKTNKKKFVGKKVGSSFEVDVNKTFTNEADRAALLKVKKEDLKDIDPIYKVTVKEIKTFVEAELNQDLYDRLFGKDVVKDEEGFNAKVEERVKADYKRESDYRFEMDTRNYLIKKCKIALPEEFLKRWLFVANEGKFTKEQIEKEFEPFAQDFRWQLISQTIAKENKLEVSKEELLAQAKKVVEMQFAMYGFMDMPEDQVENFAKSALENEQESRRIYEKAELDKVMAFVKEKVTIESKSINIEDFRKLEL